MLVPKGTVVVEAPTMEPLVIAPEEANVVRSPFVIETPLEEVNLGEGLYKHHCQIPLHVNKNLKLPKFEYGFMDIPQNNYSFETYRYDMGYGPSLKSVYINNAPTLVGSGCNMCKKC